MKKGISFYFGYVNDPKERVKLIKDAGFNCVMTSGSEKYVKQNGTLDKQVKLFEKEGVELTSLHARYDESELTHFFLNDKIGDKVETGIVEDLKTAKKYGFRCLVVHLIGVVSLVGIERFKRILKVANELKMPIALENLDDIRVLTFFMEHFKKEEFLKFCYDAGHENCFTKKAGLLEKYGKRLICLHLHDNDGKSDNHTLNKFGTINWLKLAKRLASTSVYSLDYELKLDGTMPIQEALAECKKQADELELMIKNERRKIKKASEKKRIARLRAWADEEEEKLVKELESEETILD